MVGTVSGEVVRPCVSIEHDGFDESWVAIGIRISLIVETALGDGLAIGTFEGIDEILSRTVTTLTRRVSYREVISLESVGRSRTACKDYLLCTLCLLSANIRVLTA